MINGFMEFQIQMFHSQLRLNGQVIHQSEVINDVHPCVRTDLMPHTRLMARAQEENHNRKIGDPESAPARQGRSPGSFIPDITEGIPVSD